MFWQFLPVLYIQVTVKFDGKTGFRPEKFHRHPLAEMFAFLDTKNSKFYSFYEFERIQSHLLTQFNKICEVVLNKICEISNFSNFVQL